MKYFYTRLTLLTLCSLLYVESNAMHFRGHFGTVDMDIEAQKKPRKRKISGYEERQPDAKIRKLDSLSCNKCLRRLCGKWWFYCAQNGCIKMIKFLWNLDVIKDVDHKDKGGYTALLYATRNHHCDVIKFLFDEGADGNQTYPGTEDPLIAMVIMGSNDEETNLLEAIKKV